MESLKVIGQEKIGKFEFTGIEGAIDVQIKKNSRQRTEVQITFRAHSFYRGRGENNCQVK